MKRFLLLATLFASAAWVSPAHGQLLFGKRAKVNPSQRVPELILTIKTDPDERKRARAAEELRDYDAKVYTEIVPVLADVLMTDKKMSVRAEALTSLARIRPVSALAGQAMEKAAAHDETWRVRFQARAALTKYHLAGYSARKNDAATTTTSTKKTTQEPPLGASSPAPLPRVEAPGPTPVPIPRVDIPPRPLPPSVVAPAPSKAPAGSGPSLFP